MTPTEHRAEAERLHGLAKILEGGGIGDPRARVLCVTMAHAKRLQARWHERRSSRIGTYGTPTARYYYSWSSGDLAETLAAEAVMRSFAALGPFGTNGSVGMCGGNLHEYESAGRKVK